MKNQTRFRKISACIISLSMLITCGCTKTSIENSRTDNTVSETEQNNSIAPETDVPEHINEEPTEVPTEIRQNYTLKKFLQIALEPVGSTLYTYGGGWNKEDTGAGESAVTIGVSPQWKVFYDSMDADYNSSEHRYEIENGLDCTGYIGWAIYNVFNTENGNSGYVFLAENLVNELASIGLGTVIEKESITNRQPGDIMGSSTEHHAWINVGECSDGSVVLLHASPPGVGLCAAAFSDVENSEANKLVKYYMSKYYSDYYSRYLSSTRGSSYLTEYDAFRWNSNILEDPDGYREMTADQILADLFKAGERGGTDKNG